MWLNSAKNLMAVHRNFVNKKVLIFGITSDIGAGVARYLRDDGWQVFGTSTWFQSSDVKLLDFSASDKVQDFLDDSLFFQDWSLVCFFSGTMEPIGPFFEIDFSKWKSSFEINFMSQIQILHGIWKHKSEFSRPAVCFLAGGGTNSAFDNYSSYCLSKISLIKFVELIASEYPEGNFFILGPGYVKTKIHNETLKAGISAGRNLDRTLEFLRGNGTPIENIYNHIKWCLSNSSHAISGRNFSTVHDPWDSKFDLVQLLERDQNLYKLRRRDIDKD